MLYDISPYLHEETAVWPGEERLQNRLSTSMRAGESCNVHALRASCHLGAHADAPGFLDARGMHVEQLPLQHYLGPCQLIRCKATPRGLLMPIDLLGSEITSSRVLIDTCTYNADGPFTVDFAGLSVDLIDYLNQKQVKTLGVDVPSIDGYSTANWPAHRACFAKGIALLEGLLLWKVPIGHYELSALPLKLLGFDASPVRAVLQTQSSHAS